MLPHTCIADKEPAALLILTYVPYARMRREGTSGTSSLMLNQLLHVSVNNPLSLCDTSTTLQALRIHTLA